MSASTQPTGDVKMPSEGPPALLTAQPQEAAAVAASHLAGDCKPPGKRRHLASPSGWAAFPY